jgi:hypothetical protein
LILKHDETQGRHRFVPAAAGGYIFDQQVKSKEKACKDGYQDGKKSTAK